MLVLFNSPVIFKSKSKTETFAYNNNVELTIKPNVAVNVKSRPIWLEGQYIDLYYFDFFNVQMYCSTTSENENCTVVDEHFLVFDVNNIDLYIQDMICDDVDVITELSFINLKKIKDKIWFK